MDKIASTQSYRTTYANLREYMGAGSAWTYLDRTSGEIVTDYETLKSMNENKSYWSPLTNSGRKSISYFMGYRGRFLSTFAKPNIRIYLT